MQNNNKPNVFKDDLLDEEKLLNRKKRFYVYLLVGVLVGLVGILGYSISVEDAKILFIGIIILCAALVCGFFVGILFGIPKRNTKADDNYALNNSLVEISEWLTKIIVGLGLVHLKRMPSYFASFGTYINTHFNSKVAQLDIFANATVIYFGVLGLYLGYHYMRLIFSLEIAETDIEIQNKEKLDAIHKAELAIKEKEEAEAIAQIAKENEEKAKQSESTVISETVELLNNNISNKENSSFSETGEESTLIQIAKQKMMKGLLINASINDPNKNIYGSLSIKGNRKIEANVKNVTSRYYLITLRVVSTDSNYPLPNDSLVLFALHNSYGSKPYEIVKVENNEAICKIYAYGSYTVGVLLDNGATELELDLANLPEADDYFKNN